MAETFRQELTRLRAECPTCLKCGHVQGEPNWCHVCGHRTSTPDWAKRMIDEHQAESEAREKAEGRLRELRELVDGYWERG